MTAFVKLTPSALEIYNILSARKCKMNRKEILRESNFSQRTFFYAVTQLKKNNLIKVYPNLPDMRKLYYCVT